MIQTVCIGIGISIEINIHVARIYIAHAYKGHTGLDNYNNGSKDGNSPIDF